MALEKLISSNSLFAQMASWCRLSAKFNVDFSATLVMKLKGKGLSRHKIVT